MAQGRPPLGIPSLVRLVGDLGEVRQKAGARHLDPVLRAGARAGQVGRIVDAREDETGLVGVVSCRACDFRLFCLCFTKHGRVRQNLVQCWDGWA